MEPVVSLCTQRRPQTAASCTVSSWVTSNIRRPVGPGPCRIVIRTCSPWS